MENQNIPTADFVCPSQTAPTPEPPLNDTMSFATIGGWTIQEWCDRWKISRGMYYVLKRQGRAPPVIRIGRRDRITPSGDQEWQRRQTEFV
jgi:hypothetical protein